MPGARIIKDMDKAMQVELKMGCIDTAVMGGFSTFIIKSSRKLAELYAGSEMRRFADLIQGLFAGYPEKDRNSRREVVEKGLAALEQISSNIRMEQVSRSTSDLPKPLNTPLEELPLQYLKNIGPKRARLLNKIGIFNSLDLIYHIPRRYEDRSCLKPFHLLQHGEVETAKGVILGVQDIRPRRGLTITKAALRDGLGLGFAVWFNQPFVKKQLKIGLELVITGKVDKKFGNVQISVTDFEILDNEDTTHVGRIVPVYPVTEGLPQRALRVIIKNLVDNHIHDIKETLPKYVRQRFELLGIQEALSNIHFPEEWGAVENARKRLAFEELLVLQLGLAAIKNSQAKSLDGTVHRKNSLLVEKFFTNLPFPLTAAQQRVLKEIYSDMESSQSMNRLLQGDVGSGKTIVSAAALVKTVESGFQGALMAPTEILAEQHYLGLHELFEPLEIDVSLLIGSLTKKEKEAVLRKIAEGTTNIIIGTHAIIQDEVEFHNLGLVITDEQHRFGVKQRAKLLEKGNHPDVLVMTATPIPRTLAMTVYGDLDGSVIDQMPPGRQPVKTYWVTDSKRDQMYEFIKTQVNEGRQVYFVCPLVEESDKLEVEAAVETADRLSRFVFPELKVGLLHGRVKTEEKEQVMKDFREGRIDILVATTVIEVGVNVPNATIMVVEDAERFGLAQLHQLRGRVGRGAHQSYCILIANPKTEEGRARMEIMRSTTDGFRIAEEDMKLRGPGDLMGTRQSGLPDLKIADIVKDIKLLEKARKTAFEILGNDPNLLAAEHQELRRLVLERFKNRYQFINIS